jgi:hypothetical protein
VQHRGQGAASRKTESARNAAALLALLMSCSAFALLALSPAAHAAHIHVFERTIGSQGSGAGQFETPVAAAVNDATGDIYVVDKSNNRVERFSSAGAFISQFNGSEAPTRAFSAPDQIAIDNSGKTSLEDPSVQDLYVYDSGPEHQVIDKFDPSGKYLGQITEAEAGQTFAEGLFGIATDEEGLLWVFRPTTELPEIDSFSNAESNAFLSKRSVPTASRAFAVDAHDDLYANRGDETLRKFNEAGEALIERMDNQQSTAAAVNLASNDVYIYNQTAAENAITAFGPAAICTAVNACVEPPKEALLERFGAEFGASEHLSEGRGLAVNSANDKAYAVATASNQLVAFNALVVPDVGTQAASNLTPTAATLNGLVNPDGIAVSDCHFEYGPSTSYGKLAPCTPAPGEGEAPVSVQANIAVSSSIVHYRLVASNENGTSRGADVQFRAPGPGLHGASVSEVTSESASFGATIDPNSAPTSYFFQYGTTSEYGQSVPVPPAFLGEGSGDQQTEAEPVTGLLENTTYHYRVVAISEITPGHSETFPGPDQTFITHGKGAAAGLPDGRQWELVSPVDKHGGLLEPISEGVIEASSSGDAISYLANGPTEASPEGYSNNVQVLSRRLSAGWASKDIATPHEAATGISVDKGYEYRFFSSDLSEASVQPLGSFTALSPGASEQTPYIRADFPAGNVAAPCEPSASSCYRPLVSGCPASGPCAKAIEEAADVPAGSVFSNNREDGPCPARGLTGLFCRPLFVAATPDLAHVVIDSETALAAGASGEELYEWSGGQLSLVGTAGISEKNGERSFHAISGDGERIVFDGESEGLKGLLLRQTGRGETLQLDAAEAKCLGEAGSECESGGGEFRWGTPDARKVYFTDEHKLTSDAGAKHGAPDLYECEVIEHPGSVECALSDLTPKGPGGEAADAQGVLGASEDGSYLYYATGGEEEPHVYVRHEGASRLIGVLAQADASDWAAHLKEHTARVSANGQWLAFLSQQPLTGYDTRDAVTLKPDMEVYLYGASADRLVCASCDPSGARPRGVEYHTIGFGGDRILAFEQGVAALIPGGTPITGNQSLYQSRYLSNSGRLFFNAEDALVPQDVNSTMDVYEYEPAGVPAGSPTACSMSDSTFSAKSGGCVSLISAGTSPLESAFLDASESGSDVFFLTSSRLNPLKDTDGERDVYDAHECGASAPCFPVAGETPPPCTTGESCKAAPTPQPEIFGAPPSATFSGIGNPPPPLSVAPPKAKPPTRAQLLAKALAACKKKPKAKRKGCQAAARKRYATKAKKSKRKASKRKGH